MSEKVTFLVERLSSEGERSLEFFQSMGNEQWSQIVYSEGSLWSVCDILAHFVSSEYSLRRLVENIATGGSGSPRDFDIDSYNQRKVNELKGMSPDRLMDEFLESRGKTATFVSQLHEQDLDKTGRHPFLGVVPLSEIIKIIYRHNQIHIREIRRNLK